MHHGVDPLLAQHRLDLAPIQQVALDQTTGSHRGPVAEDQVVIDPDLMAFGGQQLGRVRTNIARAACNKDIHDLRSAGVSALVLVLRAELADA